MVPKHLLLAFTSGIFAALASMFSKLTLSGYLQETLCSNGESGALWVKAIGITDCPSVSLMCLIFMIYWLRYINFIWESLKCYNNIIKNIGFRASKRRSWTILYYSTGFYEIGHIIRIGLKLSILLFTCSLLISTFSTSAWFSKKS